MDFAARFGPMVSQCEDIIGYTFESKPLCGQALNMAADSRAVYALGGTMQRMPKNDRLAVYGEAVAAAHLCGLWLDSGLPRGL